MCSENQGADQLHGHSAADLRFCFRICKNSFSHDAAHMILVNAICDVHLLPHENRGDVVLIYIHNNSERSSNSRSEFASSLYSRKQVTFLYSLQLKFLRMPHHRNFRHFNACVVHIFVLLKMKTVAILFLPTDMIHIDKSGMYLRQKQPITFPENCVRRVD